MDQVASKHAFLIFHDEALMIKAAPAWGCLFLPWRYFHHKHTYILSYLRGHDRACKFELFARLTWDCDIFTLV